VIQIDQALFDVLVDLHERSGATTEEAIAKANQQMRDITRKAAS
jgi:hypothetical protein